MASVVGGGIVARCTMGRPGPLHGAGVAFVEVMRNTPILVQIFILYFGLPSLGLSACSAMARRRMPPVTMTGMRATALTSRAKSRK